MLILNLFANNNIFTHQAKFLYRICYITNI